MELYSALNKNEIIRLAGKWMELKNHTERGNTGPERQILNLLFHIYILL